MKMTHDYRKLLSRTDAAFTKAAADTLEAAQEVAGRNARSGKFKDSLRIEVVETSGLAITALLGSPLVSARVKEKGGYIEAKNAPRLMIPQDDGSYRSPAAVRIRATPVVTVAGPRFPEFMTRRMREAAGS